MGNIIVIYHVKQKMVTKVNERIIAEMTIRLYEESYGIVNSSLKSRSNIEEMFALKNWTKAQDEGCLVSDSIDKQVINYINVL